MRVVQVVCAAGLLAAAYFAPPAPAADDLRDHPSPYLALHADDPVAWREWSPAAIDAARAGDRLLFLSVGYFACHWCHVMQRESFQDEAIARTLNDSFVPVKIDRELEPALDARLVAFAESTLGRAGWPLNVFATPEGHPLFAVLYTPPAQFAAIVERMDELWNSQRERLRSLARRVSQGDLPDALPLVDASKVADLEKVFLVQARALHDDFEGGFGSQNKFPQAPALEYLVDLAGAGQDAALPVLQTTLDAMAGQGLYDHVGGGFFRYVVDPSWATPHFEKMLYDNAQLARLYLRAAELLPGRGYADVARATLEFMRREMTGARGAMIASLSAVDGDGVEGGYYLFRDETLEKSLDAEALRVVRVACDAGGAPLLAAGHHLRCSSPVKSLAANMGVTEGDVARILDDALGKLRAVREARELPADTKLLAGWNGLALSAFSEAAIRFGDEHYGETARRLRDFLVGELWDGTRLSRARGDAGAIGSASIEDYAYVARGLWDYAALTGSETDLSLSRDILLAGFKYFRVGNGWRLGERSLLAPEPASEFITDSPMASPAAVLADLAVEMTARDGDSNLAAMAADALNRSYDTLAANAFFHATHIRALSRLSRSAGDAAQ